MSLPSRTIDPQKDQISERNQQRKKLPPPNEYAIFYLIFYWGTLLGLRAMTKFASDCLVIWRRASDNSDTHVSSLYSRLVSSLRGAVNLWRLSFVRRRFCLLSGGTNVGSDSFISFPWGSWGLTCSWGAQDRFGRRGKGRFVINGKISNWNTRQKNYKK